MMFFMKIPIQTICVCWSLPVTEIGAVTTSSDAPCYL